MAEHAPDIQLLGGGDILYPVESDGGWRTVRVSPDDDEYAGWLLIVQDQDDSSTVAELWTHGSRRGFTAVRCGERHRSSLVRVEDEVIRALVTRLARPYGSGAAVIERAALLAEGADFAEVMAWITARGGTPEAVVATVRGGLHNQHRDPRAGAVAETPRRFVLPPGVLTQ